MVDAATAIPVDPGSTAWMLISSALVLLMVPGLALVLRRPRPPQERADHDDAQLRGDGRHRRAVDPDRLRAGVRHAAWAAGSAGTRRWSAWPACPTRSNFADKAHPGTGLRHVPGQVRDHHAGAHQRRGRRADEVLGVRAGSSLLWTTFIYCPLAHWVWASGGWLFKYGVLDFAGGTVVHISSGFSRAGAGDAARARGATTVRGARRSCRTT